MSNKMSNKEIVEGIFQAAELMGRGNPDALDTVMNYYAEEAIFQFENNPPLKGKAAIKELATGFLSQFLVEAEHIIHRIVIEGDLIAQEVIAKMKLPDRKKIDWPFAGFFEMKRGTITYNRVYADMAALAG